MSLPRPRTALVLAAAASGLLLAVTTAVDAASRPGSPSRRQDSLATSPQAGKAALRAGARHRRRGARGPVGRRGAAGSPGPSGPFGPAGPGPRVQDIAIDWQNGAYAGHDTADFSVPGIGTGEVKCSPDTQWVRFFPADPGADTELWATIMRRNELAVRSAARRSYDYGLDFNLGLNEANGSESSAQGQMQGIISTRGPFGAAAAGAVAAPATFRLSWYWSFADSYGPRCYVNGAVVTGG